MTQRLADLAVFDVAVGRAPDVPLPSTRWIVLVDEDGRPAATIAPGETHPATDLVVAEAGLPVAAALDHPAFDDLPPGAPVVCVRDDDVVGVVPGDRIMDAFMLGRPRSIDNRVATAVRAPLLSRSCGFLNGPGRCGTRILVPEKPATLPPCPNAAGLAAHTFVW